MIGMKSISNPWIVLCGVWFSLLLLLLVGPINYPGALSPSTLFAIGAGGLVFLVGHIGGGRLSRVFPGGNLASHVPSPRAIEWAMAVSSVLGIVGISMIAFDRGVLSGINNTTYAAALRCAPEFVEFIKIRRTPLIYIGYLMFSFGFASVALFLLRAEEVRGWPSYLAQASIVSPVGYALLYSGRMPILLMLTQILAVVLVRASQGRTLFPRGHHLLLKSAIFVVAFAVYANAMWASRQNFCTQMGPVISQLREMTAKGAAGMDGEDTAGTISADRFAEVIKRGLSSTPGQLQVTPESGGKHFFAIMRDSWGTTPRPYVTAAIDQGVSPGKAIIVLSNYFYLTHGVMTLDRILAARDKLDPVWGVYEVGILSPIIRVFFPGSRVLQDMHEQLTASNIYGFFPTVWGAAIVDFGIVGGIIYVLLWAGLGGWAYTLSRRSHLITPLMGLVFVLASIFLSPVQGPLGVANSALVMLSMLATGAFVDLAGLISRSSPKPGLSPTAG